MIEGKAKQKPSLKRAGCLTTGVVLAAGLALLVFSYSFWLTRLASALVVDQPPSAADAIVAVSGNHFRRQLAMDFYRSGYADQLIFNVGDTTYYFGMEIDPVASVLEAASRRGIVRDSIVINFGINSTYEDALAARETARRLGLKSLLVVTSYFNGRRARFAYTRAMADMGLALSFCSVPPETEKMSLERWWTRERELVTVVNEYLKLVLYYLKY